MHLVSWELEVAGRSYAVSVERGENGKDVVRVDGRIATRPMAPEDEERTVNIGSAAYVVRRRGADEFDLDFDGPALSTHSATFTAPGRTTDAGLAILAQSDAPVALQQDSFFKRLPMAAYAAIVVVVGGMLLYMAKGPSYEKVALARVERVLSEMHAEKTSQFAVTFWFKDKKILPLAELSIASNGFDKWRQQKDLYRKVGEYHVIEAKIVDGEKVPTAIVRFNLEGTEYRVRVPKDLPISWEE